jgi:sulfur transfer protein SufE
MAELKDYPEKLREIMALFENIEDESERADYLIGYNDLYRPVPEFVAKPPYPEENYVSRCESGVYVFVEPIGEQRVNFYFSVSNPQGVSSRALSAILTETLQGEKWEVIQKIPDDIIVRLFGERVAMGKGEGMLGIVALLKYLAKKYAV